MAVTRGQFFIIRAKVVTDHLDKFPDAGSWTIARILYKDYPEYFTSVENARSVIRYYRGTSGDYSRQVLTNKKYVKIQPTR